MFGYVVSLSDDGNTMMTGGYDEDGPGRGDHVDRDLARTGPAHSTSSGGRYGLAAGGVPEGLPLRG